MPDLIERLNKLKGDDIKKLIESMPKVDTAQLSKEVTASVKREMMAVMNSYSENDEFTRKELINSVTRVVANRLDSDLTKIEEAISNLKATDLSGVEEGIGGLAALVAELKNVKPKDVDLTPILNTMNRAKVVTFEVETDAYDFPVRVIARETYEQ